MYLEVHTESSEPQVYFLDKPEMLVGNSNICDIQISIDSISKKHIKLLEFDNKWFAIDQGSTNGSYIEEEQLVPGSRREIQLNEFLRLGDTVHIVVVEEPDQDLKPPVYVPKPKAAPRPMVVEEKTRVISLKDLQSAATKTPPKKLLVKPGKGSAQEVAAKRAAEQGNEIFTDMKTYLKRKREKETKEKSISSTTLIMAAVILLVGYYLNKKFTENLEINRLQDSLPKSLEQVIRKGANGADEIVE